MAEQPLKGKRVAIIAADMVEQVELVEPRKAFEGAGANTELISIKPGEIRAFNHFDPADTFKVDRIAEEVDASDYDALFIPGGVGNPDQLRGDENIVSFVRDFFEAGQAGRGDLSRTLGARRGRSGQGPGAHIVADTPNRHSQRGREVGRPGGRGRLRARHEPEARRHSGVQPKDDRGVRRRRARKAAREGPGIELSRAPIGAP